MAVIDLHIHDETSGPALAPAVGDEHRADALDFRPDLAGWLAARSAQRDRLRRAGASHADRGDGIAPSGSGTGRRLTVVEHLHPRGDTERRGSAIDALGSSVHGDLAPVVPLRATGSFGGTVVGGAVFGGDDEPAEFDDGASAGAPVLRLVTSRPRYGLRRAIVLVVALAVGAVGWSVAGWLEGSPVVVDSVGADLTDEARPTVTVQPGDTLWSIAASLDPDGDIRALVDRLAEMNGGATLTVGQRIVLPG